MKLPNPWVKRSRQPKKNKINPPTVFTSLTLHSSPDVKFLSSNQTQPQDLRNGQNEV